MALFVSKMLMRSLDKIKTQFSKQTRCGQNIRNFAKLRNSCLSLPCLQLIWVPDTFFVNEKTALFHQATTENQFLRIMHTGDILRSIRLTIKATCPLNLEYFPMDKQMCTLEIESFGYTMSGAVTKLEFYKKYFIKKFRRVVNRLADLQTGGIKTDVSPVCKPPRGNGPQCSF